MKRQVLLSILLVSFSSPCLLISQDPASAGGQKLDVEDYQRLTTQIQQLQETLQSCRLRLDEQRDEIRKLAEEVSRMGSNKDYATRDDFKHLADKIKEVDERRIAGDKETQEKVAAEIARLGKVLSSAPLKSNTPELPTTPVKPLPSTPPKTGNEKGYEYTVRDGDNPRVIAHALVKQGVKITSQQIIDANPSVVWTKLKVGQKLFIPAAPPQ